jgi:hypothetical protein
MASAVSQQVLQGIGNDLVNEMVKELGIHVNTGFLRNAIRYEVTSDGIINIIMPEYWKYVEYGTPGTIEGKSSTVGGQTVSFSANPSRKMPVRKDGDKWTNLISGDENFALAKHIQLHGTQPYPFVRPVLYHKLRAIVAANIKRYAK